jgi:hypothetical protein
MATFLSSRLKNLKVGIQGYTDSTEVASFIGNVNIDGSIKTTTFDDGSSTGLNNYVITANGSGGWSWQSISTVGAITSPGGTDGQVQYNNGGDIGGAAQLYYDDVNSRVGVGTTTPGYLFEVDGDASFLGIIRDGDGDAGANGQILMSTGSGVNWVNAAPANAITGLNIKEEGTLQGGANAVATLDFVGSYITATVVGSTATITMTESPNFTGLTVNSNTVWHEGNDGAGSGLDADKLDGQDSTYYLNTSATAQTKSGDLTLSSDLVVSGNVGIGVTNPTQKLNVGGNIKVNTATLGTRGTNNLFFGFNALNTLTAGVNCVAIGTEALNSNNGNDNIAIGYRALYNNQSANNTAIGFRALENNQGISNTAIGYWAIRDNTTGGYNSALGNDALFQNTSGELNVALGKRSAGENLSGSHNIHLGSYNGTTTNRSRSVIIGSGNRSSVSPFPVYGFDAPKNADNQLAIGQRIGSGAASYWIVGDENYNVGIGTTNPTQKLDVGGNITSSGQFISTITTGISPFLVSSTTVVANLNSDLLDGQDGSYYLNTSTTFGGDVSGTYDAIVIANDSHTHDGRYYTETESDARFLRKDTSDTLNGNLTLTGELHGPATFILDPAAVGDNTGTLVVRGNLQVDGVTTTINSTVVSIDDKNIVLASGAADAAAADGAGITIDGASATLTYAAGGDSWVFNKAPYYNSSRLLTTADEGSGNGLDADTLDGQEGSYYRNASNINAGTIGDAYLPATISSDITGNAATATKLATSRTIALSGDVTGSVGFDGSANVTINATVADDSHTHDGRYYTETEADARFLGINAKAADSELLDGINSTSFLRSDANDDFTGTLWGNNVGGTYFNLRGGSDGNTLLMRVSAADANEDISANLSGDYGFNIRYRGDLSGVENALQIDADNQVGTAIEALRIKQNGVVYFGPSPYVGSNVIWHAGNDGAGTGLDADLLDGQQGSYYLNTSTAFGGDVSGTYNAIVVANDSHTHDTRYYTEAESDARFLGINAKAADSELLDGINSTSFLRSDQDDVTTGKLTAKTLALTNDATDTSNHRIAVYDAANGISYGMMLWNSNGTSGEWSTMIYGPNESARRISFGKVNTTSFINHASVTEIAYFDLDDSTLRLDADAYVGSNVVWNAGNDGAGSGLDADTLDGQQGSYYLDWGNVSNKPDPTITVTLSGDVTGTANTTLTDLASGTITVATTIAANSVALGTDTTGNYVAGVSAGSGIVVSGTAGEGWTATVTHADTSSQTSVDNSNGTVIQDITLDEFGHITAIGSTNLDGRYYTETESDARFLGINAKAADSELLDGIDSGSFLRSDANDSASGTYTFSGGGDDVSNTPTLELTAGYISISHDEVLLKFDEGQKMITSNDAAGNFNIRAGHDNDQLHVSSSSGDSGMAAITLGSDGINGEIHLYVGPQRAAGSTAYADYGLSIERGISGLSWRTGSDTYGGNLATEYKIWHAGNDGSGSGLDADTLDGLQSTQFLRADSATTFTGGILTLNSATPEIHFNGTSDSGIDMAIKATPEGLDFYEPEDSNRIHFRIYDDAGVDSTFGYWINGTRVLDSSRQLSNVTYGGNTIWHAGNDGSGSGLDADLLDGQQGSYYLDTSATTQTKSGGLNVSGNVGIGTDNPPNLLSLGAATGPVIRLTETTSGVFSIIVGEATTGGLLFSADHGNIGADTPIKFSTDGNQERLRITSTGNVGIGTTNPSNKLNVTTSQNASIIARFNDSTSATDSTAFIAIQTGYPTNQDNEGVVKIGARRNGNGNTPHLIFYTANNASTSSERMVITGGTGNVGIGTTNPGQKLTVHGAISINQTGKSLYLNAYPGIQDNTVSFEAIRADFTTGASVLEISTKDDTDTLIRRMRIDHEGNVGIGPTVTAPSARLHVEGDIVAGKPDTVNSNFYGLLGIRTLGSGLGGYGMHFVSGYENPIIWGYNNGLSDGLIRFSSMTSNNRTLGSGLTDRMVIRMSDGNVGIGITNPTKKLHVVGGEIVFDTVNNGYSGFKISDDSSGDYNVYFDIGRNQALSSFVFRSSGRVQGTTPWSDSGSPATIAVFNRSKSYIPSGNVGIGTTDPAYKLDVIGGNVRVGKTSNGKYIAENNLGQSKVVIDSSGISYLNGGNVGIGTDNPQSKLHVEVVGSTTSSTNLSEINDVGNSNVSRTFKVGSREGTNAPGYSAFGVSISSSADNSSQNKQSVYLMLGSRDPSLNGLHGSQAYQVFSTPDAQGTYGTGQLDFYIRNSVAYGIPNDPAVSSQYWMPSLFTIKSSGNIGIGTTNPTDKLHIYGGASNYTPTGDGTGLFKVTGGASSQYSMYIGIDNNGGYIGHNGASRKLFFDVNETTRMTIDASGNVGIGVTDPTNVLSINGGTESVGIKISNTDRLTFGADGTWNYIKGKSGNGHYFNTTGGALMVITNDGKVGIGTAAPNTQAKLDVRGNLLLQCESASAPNRLMMYPGISNLEASSRIEFWESAPTSTYADANASIEYNANTTYGGDGAILIRGYTSSANQIIAGFSRGGYSFFTGNVGIGTTNPQYKLEVNGSFAATTKSFIIPHPTKPGYKLRHGSLEGPENGVYVRGRSKDFIIELPDYWVKLVDADSITVNLTPVGKSQTLWVKDIKDNKVYVGSKCSEVHYFYTVFAERVDVERLQTEINCSEVV